MTVVYASDVGGKANMNQETKVVDPTVLKFLKHVFFGNSGTGVLAPCNKEAVRLGLARRIDTGPYIGFELTSKGEKVLAASWGN